MGLRSQAPGCGLPACFYCGGGSSFFPLPPERDLGFSGWPAKKNTIIKPQQLTGNMNQESPSRRGAQELAWPASGTPGRPREVRNVLACPTRVEQATAGKTFLSLKDGQLLSAIDNASAKTRTELCRQTISRIFEEAAPERLCEVAQLLRKHKGNEKRLVREIRRDYCHGTAGKRLLKEREMRRHDLPEAQRYQKPTTAHSWRGLESMLEKSSPQRLHMLRSGMSKGAGQEHKMWKEVHSQYIKNMRNKDGMRMGVEEIEKEKHRVGINFFPTSKEAKKDTTNRSRTPDAWSAKVRSDSVREQQEKQYVQEKAKYWENRVGKSPEQMVGPPNRSPKTSSPKGARPAKESSPISLRKPAW
jgi:hypothetical protein